MHSFKDVWEKALVILKNDLNSTSFGTWIKLLVPMKMENDVAYFCVSTLFQQNILEKKYKRDIEKAISDVMGFDVTIKILREDEVPPRIGDIAHRVNDEVNQELPIIEEFLDHELQPFNAKSGLTFENFVVGKENEFAHAAALAIANNPAGAYNPFFLYGHSGLGKTHLINAIANKIRENNPNLVIVYVKGDEFTSELIEAIQHQTQRQFKNKYRQADILLMDDVQFLSGKPSVQEEMFHTFDSLYENNRQIILTSDRPPKDLNNIEERLQSRFAMGLTADVQPPEYETRVAIIKRKAKYYNLNIPDDVVELIASKIKSNVRELEGTIKKLKAYNSLWGQTPTIVLAKDAMEAVIKENASAAITPDSVIDEVSRYFDVSVDKIKGDRKTADIVLPRQVAMYIIREKTSLSLPEIGKALGGKNHTTVLHSINKISDTMKQDPQLNKIISELIENIKKSY
ncbi:MAG: chromosomal replication initiator protein DnaA [Clostridia bacterium]|nr:chromosomal replication initiator protein DnaA [Clostridia bacterium]